MKVLVTGSNGFVGKNMIEKLLREKIEVVSFDKDQTLDDLTIELPTIDFIYHFAGVNRPKSNDEFYEGNKNLLENVIDWLEMNNHAVPILFTSSIQVEKDNDYGKSKLLGEEVLVEYSKRNNVPVYIYRLPNVFGKWSRPNYNTVIATWCHQITRNEEIIVNDRNAALNLVYIDDVVNHFFTHLTQLSNETYYSIPTVYSKTLGEIADLLTSFKDSRKNLTVEHVGVGFERCLYATYLSFIPSDDLGYTLTNHQDERGNFIEFIKTKESGQVSISTTKPNIVRGNHYHNTKNEKFFVVQGTSLIRIRYIETNEIVEYTVHASEHRVIDIPVGTTHSFKNIGEDDLITLIWANETFDPSQPDTYFLEV